MKRRTLLLTALPASFISALLVWGNVAHAGPGCGGKGKHGGYEMSAERQAKHMEKKLNRIAKKLDLSSEQKAKMKQLRETHKNEMKPLRDEKRAIREEMRKLDANANDYAAKLADVANRQAEVSRQLTIAKGNFRQQIASILTPEQLAKKEELRGKFEKKHRRHHRKHDKS